jgi:hypothetical protein
LNSERNRGASALLSDYSVQGNIDRGIEIDDGAKAVSIGRCFNSVTGEEIVGGQGGPFSCTSAQKSLAGETHVGRM